MYEDFINVEMFVLGKKASQLCRLFKGRLNESIAAELIDEKGSLQDAAAFIMLGDPDAVRERLNQNEEYVRELQEDAEKFMRVLESPVAVRQFACKDCNSMWWRKVPTRKEVSTCHGCNRKFDPIPREHEWGIGRFECECTNTFIGFGIMGRTKSRCYACSGEVPINEIIPPKDRDKQWKYRPPPLKHNCNGINCYRHDVFQNPGSDPCFAGRSMRQQINQDGADPGDDGKPPVCIHPSSGDPVQRTRIHWASELHVSTGSTLATFLDQESLITRTLSIALTLDTIDERLHDFDEGDEDDEDDEDDDDDEDDAGDNDDDDNDEDGDDDEKGE